MNEEGAGGGVGGGRVVAAGGTGAVSVQRCTVNANQQSHGKPEVSRTTPSHAAWSIFNFCSLGSPSDSATFTLITTEKKSQRLEEDIAFQNDWVNNL